MKWSPTHPTVFCAIDGTGRLDLWNLNYSTEVPLRTEQVKLQDTLDNTSFGLNKLEWNRNGSKCCVGTTGGHILVYDIGKDGVPTEQDTNSLLNILKEANQKL